MKGTRKLSLLLAVVLVVSLFTGCGGAANQKMEAAAYDMMAATPMEAPAAEENGLRAAGTAQSAALPESRKWIVTVHMSAETEDLDSLTADLDGKIKALNGYVEDQSIHNGSNYSSRRYRNASLTIRIPAEKVDQFTQEVTGIANVVSQSKNLEDVTLKYVATESRVQALETEQARLLELLSQADNMADLLEIEARLTDVRYELENHASQLRLYDNQIDYATIYLNIEEVQEYTPVEEPTLWERIQGGFSDSMEGLGESIQDLLVFLVVAAPYLVVYGGSITLVILLTKKLRKGWKEKKALRKAAKAAKKAEKESK